jgi:hypothetical protein
LNAMGISSHKNRGPMIGHFLSQRDRFSFNIRSDAFWALIRRCWAQLPADRPSFKDIVELLQTSSELILSGTDLDEYRRYQRRLAPTQSGFASGNASGNAASPKRPRSGTTGGEGPTFARLVADGIPANRSPPPSGGKVHRYDFTRSKLKRAERVTCAAVNY